MISGSWHRMRRATAPLRRAHRSSSIRARRSCGCWASRKGPRCVRRRSSRSAAAMHTRRMSRSRLSLQRTDGQSVQKLPPLQKVAQGVFRLSLADGSEWADGSYRLTVTASDRAGNTQREEISFLVNQSGSTFLSSAVGTQPCVCHTAVIAAHPTVQPQSADTVADADPASITTKAASCRKAATTP